MLRPNRDEKKNVIIDGVKSCEIEKIKVHGREFLVLDKWRERERVTDTQNKTTLWASVRFIRQTVGWKDQDGERKGRG